MSVKGEIKEGAGFVKEEMNPCCAPPTPSLAHRQAFFAIEPIDAVDPGRFAVLAQQDEQAPIAEALPCVGEIVQLRPKFRVRRAS